jgi:hypothetical protein
VSPGATAIITLIGSISLLGLAVWFWRRGKAQAQAPGHHPSRDGSTQFIPKDQLFVGTGPQDGATEFIDPQVAFRLADQARAQAGAEQHERAEAPAATEYIPRDELMNRIAGGQHNDLT